MHLLHKAIASRAKARITALKQSLELNMSLVASGTRILTYTASGDPGVPGRNLTGSRRIARVTVTVVTKNLKRKGKCDKSSGEWRIHRLGGNDRCNSAERIIAIARLQDCTFVRTNCKRQLETKRARNCWQSVQNRSYIVSPYIMNFLIICITRDIL